MEDKIAMSVIEERLSLKVCDLKWAAREDFALLII